MKIYSLPVPALLLALSLPAAATARDLGDVSAGYDLARGVCATCHRVERGETEREASRRRSLPDHRRQPVPKRRSDLRVFLKSPHRNMPDLILSETEIDSVIAYIQSLKSTTR